MIQLRLTTNPGIEDVVEEELRDRAGQKSCQITKIQQKPFNLDGQVFVEGSEPALSEVSL